MNTYGNSTEDYRLLSINDTYRSSQRIAVIVIPFDIHSNKTVFLKVFCYMQLIASANLYIKSISLTTILVLEHDTEHNR